MKRRMCWLIGIVVLGSIAGLAVMVLAKKLADNDETDPYSEKDNWGRC